MTMSMNEGELRSFLYDDEELIIDKESDDVIYNDEKHIYVGKSGLVKDKKFISVTTLIGMYENKFDEEFWKRYKALEKLLDPTVFNPIKKLLLDTKKWDDKYIPSDLDIKLFNDTCQEFVNQWKETNKTACEYGTKIHADQENGFYYTPDKMIKKFGLGGDLKVNKNYHKLDIESGIIPEMLISYSDPDAILNIAGQSDLIVKQGNDISVLDFKTNKELKQKSYYDPKRKKYEMMKPPLTNIMDCNYMHYTLQLSLYAWMIQRQNPEFNIKELRIIHFEHSGEVKEYILDYLKDDIEKLLKHHKRMLIKQQWEDERKPIIF